VSTPLTSFDLAKELGCSRWMVKRYEGDGMPTAGTNDRGHTTYDPDVCRAWKAANVSTGGRGGNHGGGRPKGSKAAPKPPRTKDEPVLGSLVEEKAKREYWAAQKLELEVLTTQGKLLDAEECRRSRSEFIGAVGRAIHDAPARIAAALAVELKLDSAGLLKAKAMLEREADETVERLIADAERMLGAAANDERSDGDPGGSTESPASEAAAAS